MRGAVRFTDIQPILAQRCFACHGTGKQEAGLSLQRRASAVTRLESGNYTIVPGVPDQSELLRRVTAADPTG